MNPKCNGCGEDADVCACDPPYSGRGPTPVADFKESPAEEIARLRAIIAGARHDLCIPGDPDCLDCGGLGDMAGDDGQSGWCDCNDPYLAAIERMRKAEESRSKSRAQFEADHGHLSAEKCRPDCPLPF